MEMSGVQNCCLTDKLNQYFLTSKNNGACDVYGVTSFETQDKEVLYTEGSNDTVFYSFFHICKTSCSIYSDSLITLSADSFHVPYRKPSKALQEPGIGSLGFMLWLFQMERKSSLEDNKNL
jgi:hypothetical protein